MAEILLSTLYILCGIAASVFWKIYICRMNKAKRTPIVLLILLVLTCIPIGELVTVVSSAITPLIESFSAEDSIVYSFFDSYFGTALVEEGFKFIFLLLLTIRSRSFTHSFDGVVYSAFVSLSFAGYENFYYICDSGLSIAPLRALISTAGHLFYSLFMGMYYSRAKYRGLRKDHAGMWKSIALSLLIPIFLHGTFDFYIDYSTLFFIAYLIPMYPCIYCILRKESTDNRPFSYTVEELPDLP